METDGNRPDWEPGTGMIYLGMSAWDGMWKSRQQLMSRFSAEMPILYVEPWVTLRSLRKGKRTLREIAQHFGRTRVSRHEPNVSVLHSSTLLPVSGSRMLGSMTRRMWIAAVKNAARSSGITRPILWVCRPELGFAIGSLGEKFSIYHVVDEYAGYTGQSESAVERLLETESHTLDRVDVTVAASPELVKAKSAPGRDVILLENAVEPTAYRNARAARKKPRDIESLSGPKIGYCGLIGKRLNLGLLQNLAEARPDYRLIMIGKVDPRESEVAIARLAALPNVHFLGEKGSQDVPDYITSLDVGLLPYAVNIETRHISPIKMYEYWAAGIPVVSTGIPAAIKHEFALEIADDSERFIAKVDDAIDRNGVRDEAYLLALAEENSWQSRVDSVRQEIKVRLNSRKNTTGVQLLQAVAPDPSQDRV